MTQYSKLNIIYRLQKWMDSVPGQTFLNYAYSWGAAIVILGTLFKLTHIPGANFWLFLGMGTEVFVFFLSAFDRPFDKTAAGMDLPTHLNLDNEEVVEGNEEQTQVAAAAQPVVTGGGTIIIGGGAVGGSGQASDASRTSGTSQTAVDTEAIAAVSSSVSKMSGVSGEAVLPSMNPELEEATTNYVEELKRLTEMLSNVSRQSERLATDSEEMENLNRTLTGICKVYEMQLKSASSQIGTIDEINDQTKKMASQIAELNQIYQRMIEAMTVNMPKAPLVP